MTAIERTRRGTPPLVLLLVLVIAACSEGTTTQPPAVSVTVSPATTTIGAGDTGSFTATVANATNDAVTWSASAGTLAGTGPNAVEWTAPVSGGTATITATSMEDPSASASAAVTVTPVVVAVTPQTSAFFRGEERTFTASVTGTSTTAVSWDATCGTGTATGNTFAYVAPTTAGTSCTITATSDLDPMADAVVTGSVRQAWLVTSGDDVADGSCTWAHCSLREAMNSANSLTGVDTILLDPNATGPSPASGAFGPPASPARVTTVQPTAALPIVTDDLVMWGEGSSITTIDVGATVGDPRRGLHVQGDVTLTLSGLTIQNAVASGFGGGILLEGGATGANLHATDIHLLNNAANDGEGGGLALIGSGTQATLEESVIDGNRTIAGTIVRPGGGITVTAGTSLTMIAGSISGNQSDDGWGGAIRAIDFGTITLDGVTLDGNEALDPSGGYGGALHAEVAGAVVITGTTITNNSAALEGGGFRFVGGATLSMTQSTVADNTAATAAGGLFSNGAISITESAFERNTATAGAGGLWLGVGSVVTAQSVDFVDNAGGAHSGAVVLAGVTHDFDGGRVEGNQANFAGGFNVADGATTIENMVFTSNESFTSSAGGLASQFAATLVVRDSEFTANTSAVAGGGLWIAGGAATLERVVVTGNNATLNGGGLTAGSPTSTTIVASTISGNTAGGRGGGVNAGAGPVTIENSTISGNAGDFGGGLATIGPVLLTNTTLYGNAATTDGGGLLADGTAGSTPDITLQNTLIVSNTDAAGADNCAVGAGGGSFTSEDGNLSDDATCTALTQPADQSNTAAGLDTALADNGGPTLTHALQSGSAAIDAAVGTNCPAADQRGAPRVGTCDIGAVEFGSTPPGS